MTESEKKSKKVYVTLPERVRVSFDALVAMKYFGETDSEVARHFIITGLEALIESGRIRDPLKP
jgi:hypothetical protein